jgi:hypothetical protein
MKDYPKPNLKIRITITAALKFSSRVLSEPLLKQVPMWAEVVRRLVGQHGLDAVEFNMHEVWAGGSWKLVGMKRWVIGLEIDKDAR